ncbi:pyruvyl transferase Pvg1 [Bulinus truncatus]|nr:pyruvyl transferase Pvg1 [Bulinus truncatus]
MLVPSTSQTVIAVITFVAWTISSFISHESGKLSLNYIQPLITSNVITEASNFISSFLLTTAQCLTCVMCIILNTDFRSTTTGILVLGHVLATLATNYSMTYIEAASTLAIKLTEPVTMVLAHHVVFKTPVSMETIVSVPLIILGAILFTMKSILDTKETTGIFLAFLSNIILTARNVTIKKLQGDNIFPVELRSISRIIGLVLGEAAIIMIVFLLGNFLPANFYFLLGAMFLSGIGHVTYSYISTNIVLKVINIVSHSIANIFKRLLVVLLLYAVGKRSATTWNILGLTIAIGGLYVYMLGKIKTNSQNQNGQTSYLTSKTFHRVIPCGLALVSTVILIKLAIPSNQIVYDTKLQDCQLNTSTNKLMLETQTKQDPKLAEFLTWRLVDHPEETDMRSKTLTTNVEIIEEAQRVLINLLTDLIGPIKHVMLMEIATYANKGDPAIAAGEIMLLRKMNKTIVYYCETYSCNQEHHIRQEIAVSKKYTKDNLVILMQGGGNLVGYSVIDKVREAIINRYPQHTKIILSQSIWLNNRNMDSLYYAQKVYSNQTNLIIFLRDRQSLEIAKKYFKGVRLILAPDLAIGLGALPRQMPPMYDILWIQRKDLESNKYVLPSFPRNLTVVISDWTTQWTSNVGSRDMETCFLIAFSGLNFLQRGRVVVTDRLHGHILSTLLNIPHVLIDNPPYLKLSSFDKSWTESLENTVLINNGTLGLEEALKLLKKYDSVLPQVGPVDMNRFPNV